MSKLDKLVIDARVIFVLTVIVIIAFSVIEMFITIPIIPRPPNFLMLFVNLIVSIVTNTNQNGGGAADPPPISSFVMVAVPIIILWAIFGVMVLILYAIAWLLGGKTSTSREGTSQELSHQNDFHQNDFSGLELSSKIQQQWQQKEDARLKDYWDKKY